jgi:hypothetical protein
MLGRKVRVNWGAQFFDYDNDGDEDLYIVSGHLPTKLAAVGLEEDAGRGPDPQPNMLLENDRGVFADVSLASGADNPGVGRGSSYLDFNNDGCLDLAVTGYGGSASLYKNRCLSGDNWLTVQTVGTTANRDGIGARITLVAGGKTQIREVLSGASHMGDNMRAAHFGLGTAPVVDSLTVRWPGGKAQTLTDVATNQRITVTEPR